MILFKLHHTELYVTEEYWDLIEVKQYHGDDEDGGGVVT